MQKNTKRAEKLRIPFPIGQRVELVSIADTRNLQQSGEYLSYGFDETDIRARLAYPDIPVGTPGTVRGIDDCCQIEVLWDTGVTTKIASGIDFIRAINAQVIVRRPGEKFHMASWELAQWANTVHKIAGGKRSPFTSIDFPARLKGHHCSCGITNEGYTKGIFELLPVSSEEVRTGEKAYMRCTKCGGYSHL